MWCPKFGHIKRSCKKRETLFFLTLVYTRRPVNVQRLDINFVSSRMKMILFWLHLAFGAPSRGLSLVWSFNQLCSAVAFPIKVRSRKGTDKKAGEKKLKTQREKQNPQISWDLVRLEDLFPPLYYPLDVSLSNDFLSCSDFTVRQRSPDSFSYIELRYCPLTHQAFIYS